MPRSHYKTTIATIAHTIQLILNDPEIRILVVADTGANAERFMLEIGNHLRYNDYLKWLYPEIIPDFNTVRWNTKEIVVRRKSPWREPTVDAIGAGGGVESRHYDWIKADDLVTEKHIRSDAEMDKLIAWTGGLESLLIHDQCNIDFVGSRKKKGDFYEHLEKYYGGKREPRAIGPHAYLNGELAVFSRSVIENGEMIFPYDREKKSGVSKKFIVRLRTHDPARYWSQYANSPKSTGLNVFNIEDVRFYEYDEKKGLIYAVYDKKLLEKVHTRSLDRIVLYDPSVAERSTSSKQAIIVVGKGSGPFRYVLETHIGHFPPDEAIELLFEMDRKWNPGFFSIERRGFQGSIKYWLHEKADRERIPHLQVIEYPPPGSPNSQRSKVEHIRGLQPLVRAHLLWLREDMEELIEEIEFYPNIRWDDGLDALAQGLEYWPYSMDEAEIAAGKKAEAIYLARVVGGAPVMAEREEKSREFNEMEFLKRFTATGYGLKLVQ